MSQLPITEILDQPLPTGIDWSPDEYSCFSSSIGYLMFRLDAPEQLWLPTAIDEVTGRQPNGLTYDTGSGVIALMEQGAKVTNVHALDNERFVEEGLRYLEEYYADTWLRTDPINFYEYWQPDRVTAQREYTAQLLEVAKQRPDQWSAVSSSATPERIKTTLQAGDVILLGTRRVESDLAHYMVLLSYQETDDRLIVFDSAKKPPIQPINFEDFTERLLAPEGSMVVVHDIA